MKEEGIAQFTKIGRRLDVYIRIGPCLISTSSAILLLSRSDGKAGQLKLEEEWRRAGILLSNFLLAHPGPLSIIVRRNPFCMNKRTDGFWCCGKSLAQITPADVELSSKDFHDDPGCLQRSQKLYSMSWEWNHESKRGFDGPTTIRPAVAAVESWPMLQPHCNLPPFL
jgi:hypothetical protein